MLGSIFVNSLDCSELVVDFQLVYRLLILNLQIIPRFLQILMHFFDILIKALDLD